MVGAHAPDERERTRQGSCVADAPLPGSKCWVADSVARPLSAEAPTKDFNVPVILTEHMDTLTGNIGTSRTFVKVFLETPPFS